MFPTRLPGCTGSQSPASLFSSVRVVLSTTVERVCLQTQGPPSFLDAYTLGMSQGKNEEHHLLPQRRAMSSRRGPSCGIFLTDGEVAWVDSEEGETFAVTVLTAALSFC